MKKTENNNKTSFVKQPNGKYAFIMETPDFKRIEEVDKEHAKRVYEGVLQDKRNYEANLSKAIKEYNQYKVDKDDKMEEFIAMADRAASYNKSLQAAKTRDNMLDMLDIIRKQCNDMEIVLPELKRMKK